MFGGGVGGRFAVTEDAGSRALGQRPGPDRRPRWRRAFFPPRHHQLPWEGQSWAGATRPAQMELMVQCGSRETALIRVEE